MAGESFPGENPRSWSESGSGGDNPDKKDTKKTRKGASSSSPVRFGANSLASARQEAEYAEASTKAKALGGLFVEQGPSERPPEDRPKKKKKDKGKSKEKESALPTSESEATAKPEAADSTAFYAQSERSAAAGETAAQSKPEASDDDSDERDGDDREYNEKNWPAQEYELPLNPRAQYVGEMIDLDLNGRGPIPEHLQPKDELEKQEAASEEGTTEIPAATPVGRVAEAQLATLIPDYAAWQEQAERQQQILDMEAAQQAIPTEGVVEAAPVASPIPPAAERLPTTPVPETTVLPAEEAAAPFSEPYAPMTEISDDLPRSIPMPEYVKMDPDAGAGGAWNPAEAYRRYEQRESAARGAYSSNERAVTKQELDDAVYYAASSAQSRGLVTGLFTAGVVGHFLRRGERRRNDRRFKEQGKQLQKTREDHHFYFTEQARQHEETKRRLGAVEQRSAYAERQMYEHKTQAEQISSELAGLREANERRRVAKPELPKLPAPDGVETMVIPQEHVVQSSAWHNIEVDKRTGRPVETPTFAYGHEYYRERAHENGPAAHRNAAAGEVALAAAARASSGAVDDQNTTSPQQPPYIPSATTQGSPPSRRKSAANAIRGQLTKSSATGPIWPYLIALVVILFCLIILLH